MVVALLNFTAGNLIGVFQRNPDVTMEETMRAVIPDNRHPCIFDLYLIRHIDDLLVCQSLFFVYVGNLVFPGDKKLPLNEGAGLVLGSRGLSWFHYLHDNRPGLFFQSYPSGLKGR